MKLEKLTPGQIVYSAERGRMGNTTEYTVRLYRVKIISINLANQSVEASWNGNPPQKFYRGTWKKWRVEEPLMIKVGNLGRRLATREEIKAMKAKANTCPMCDVGILSPNKDGVEQCSKCGETIYTLEQARAKYEST